MHHHRYLRILAIFFPSLTGVTPQDPVMTWLARTLDADDMLAVFGVDLKNAVKIDVLNASEFRHAVARRQDPMEPRLMKALIRFADGLDDIFAKTMEIGFARGSRHPPGS